MARSKVWDWTPWGGHKLGAAGDYAKFLTNVDDGIRALVDAGLHAKQLKYYVQEAGRIALFVDMGTKVGTTGRTSLRIVVGMDGRIMNAYPANTIGSGIDPSQIGALLW